MSSLLADPLTAKVLLPEFTLVVGMVLMMLVPNLGNATFRLPIPNTSIRLPYFLGGKRFGWSSSPRVPGIISVTTLMFAAALAIISQTRSPMFDADNVWCIAADGVAYASCLGIPDDGLMLRVDGFSRLLEVLFFGALMLAATAAWYRLPATPRNLIHADELREPHESRRIQMLLDNRRQVDFHLLVLMTAFGMAFVALAADLFLLFVGLELAALSSYVLVSFLKENKSATEGGVKYFIVGSVSSAVGLYGLSLLYLWNGSLQISGVNGLAGAWAGMGDVLDPLALFGLSFLLVGIAFKVSAAPFHLATPDAYTGAASPVAGVLATASKAMGFVVLLRILVTIAMPEQGSAFWVGVIGLLAAVTMTWGNFAALSSSNPKRMLAYSSVAHAGYLLAAVAAIGVNSVYGTHVVAQLLVAAMLFHLVVLVTFKLGSFLVLALVEIDGEGSDIRDFHGLAQRDPIIALAMFVFMLSLAGVPPFAGFLSKLLMVSGIVDATVHQTMTFDDGLLAAIGSLHWVFWLAVLVFLNSALSLFYYLRLGWVMFFEAPPSKAPLAPAPFLRLAIVFCMIGAVAFGFGPFADQLIVLVSNAAESLFALA